MVKTSPSHPETGNIKIYANRQYRGTTDKDGLLMFKANKRKTSGPCDWYLPTGRNGHIR